MLKYTISPIPYENNTLGEMILILFAIVEEQILATFLQILVEMWPMFMFPLANKYNIISPSDSVMKY